MKEKELRIFIKENSPFIYEYINKEVLKDIGVMNPRFFVKLVNEFFNIENRKYKLEDITKDSFSYYLIAEVIGESREAFTYFRKDTITLDELYKELRLYFNYVKFTVEDEVFDISFIQSKAGVTAFENEIVKFSKSFTIKKDIEKYISKKSNILLNEEQNSIKMELNNIL